MSEIVWEIPPSVLSWLEAVPRDRPVAMFIRHSVRGQLPDDAPGAHVPLLPVGFRLARRLGERLATRLRSVVTSPVLRCQQTALELSIGAGLDAPIPDDRMLGDPGAYVHSGKQAWPAWQKLGHKGVLATMTQGEEQLDGFADAAPATRALARHMLAQMGDENGIHAFVTHDFLITILASRLIGDALAKVDWPWFLEAVFLWREGAHIHVAYRERHAMSLHAEFIPLDDRDVVDFAKRQLAQVVGLDYPGRLFLAGGAFKSLLTGKPAKDLDVWAPSANDRELLIGHLLERGAERLPPTDLGDQFCIAGIEVDVPRRIEPDSLEDRLARFDLTLSAIGVEHINGVSWRPVVDPRARRDWSVGEVRLLLPLVNAPYALATLERARRYASELGFQLPASEEEVIWRVFLEQADDGRAAMVQRLIRVGRGGYGVREEAERNCLGNTLQT